MDSLLFSTKEAVKVDNLDGFVAVKVASLLPEESVEVTVKYSVSLESIDHITFNWSKE